MTGWGQIAAFGRGAAIVVLVAIAWWAARRRRARSRPTIDMTDARRKLLRELAASDYTPKRHDRKETAP